MTPVAASHKPDRGRAGRPRARRRRQRAAAAPQPRGTAEVQAGATRATDRRQQGTRPGETSGGCRRPTARQSRRWRTPRGRRRPG
eukprot:2924355-Alexandrium_andersonii.AAC.1